MNKERPQACSRCGATLPPDAPQGLCPRCLGAFDFTKETAVPGAAATAQPPPPPEDIAPHFPQLEILECLGRGGMGIIYKAQQKALGRPVALKILAPEREKDPEFAARFTREAQALAKLDHPHIVTIHDFGQAGGFFYLLMEFVDGVNLRQAMRAGRFTPQQALAVVPQICEALQFAHDRGIVHRDIKPENILLDRQGRLKIADFGVAKIFGREGLTSPEGEAEPAGLTQAKGVLGTPRYMAPEQVTHPLDVDHRADIYSLGVVFYEMLTGELPAARIEPPSKKVVIDVRLDEVVLRALATEPARRYQHASDVGTMVETIATTPAGSKASAKKSGMTRIMEIFFDITFTSPWAIRCLNASALGFLGFLGALRFLEIDQLRWTAGFSGFFGLFGLIGAAFLIEMMARGKGGRSNAPSERGAPPVRPVANPALQQVKGPAIGLIVTGILNWILIPLITMMIMAYRAIGPSGQPALLVVPIVALVLCSLTIFGALKMKGLESYGWAMTAAVLAILVSPGNIIGLPLGIWALAVLMRPDVRAAFRAGRPTPAVQTPRSVPPGGLPLFVEREGRRRLHWPGVLMLCGTVGLVVGGGTLAIALALWLLNAPFRLTFQPGELLLLLMFMAACAVMCLAARQGGASGPPGSANPDWRLWSPLQPPMVREICAHMTEAEKREAALRGLLFGLWNAMTFFGPLFCVMFMSLPSPMGWIYGGAILIVGLSFYPLWRRMAREFLCSTAWARQRGIKPDQLKHFAPCGLAKGFGGLLLSILIAFVLAFFIRGFVLEAYFATSDAVSPEIPRKSFVLVYKLVRSFAPGDIIVYRDGGRAMLARVAQPGPQKGLLEINRGTRDPVRLQVAQVSGKVIFNTRPDSGPEPFSSGTISRPASQESPTPGIGRVFVESGRATVGGWANADSRFVLAVGEGQMGCGFINELPFTATVEAVDWGRGFACTIKDSIGNVLLTQRNSRIGPMRSGRGAIVFRKGAPSPEPDGSHVIGEFRPKSGAPVPVTVGLEKSVAPTTASDRILVEDIALRLCAAIRDKEDAVLKELATDRVPGWRDALPAFAFELRERYTHLTGKPFGAFPEDSLVVGDFAVVRCTGPDELQGKCLVLGFVRTPAGWRNWNLRNSTRDVALRRHLDDFKAQQERQEQSPPAAPRAN